MPGSVARLPNGSHGDDDGIPPADLYKIAVDEYRFQATFNWSRTQYLLALNVAILAAATAVASRPGHSAALVFALGGGCGSAVHVSRARAAQLLPSGA